MTTLKLVAAAFACAVFTGVRGGLFTVGIARLNIRLRTQLFNSLLLQDMGFYDSAKSGGLHPPPCPTCRAGGDVTAQQGKSCYTSLALALNAAHRPCPAVGAAMSHVQ